MCGLMVCVTVAVVVSRSRVVVCTRFEPADGEAAGVHRLCDEAFGACLSSHARHSCCCYTIPLFDDLRHERIAEGFRIRVVQTSLIFDFVECTLQQK